MTINIMRESIDPETLAPVSLGDLPLVVLTSGKTTNDVENKLEIFSKIEIKLKSELVALSSNSHHILAENSGHFIMYDEPKLVIRSIEEIIKTNP